MDNCQWVLYVRRDPRFHCPLHWNPASASPTHLEGLCTTCYGFGVKIDLQVVPCRITLDKPVVSHRENDTRTSAGWMQYFRAAADFPRAVMPREEDLIVVCEWNRSSQTLGDYPRARVIRMNTVYCIKQINDYFERELSHFGCGLEMQQQDMERLARHLPVLINVPVLDVEQDWSQRSYW